MASGGYDQRQERLANYSIKEQSEEEMESEFVVVPRELKSHVIGKGGCMLHEIMQKSGAKVSSQSGFTVSGDKEQRACAKRLIEEKVQNIKSTMWEQVRIPDKYKGLVMGTRGAKLREISAQTGAKVIYNKDGEVYITCGTDEQRKNAQAFIGIAVSDGRIRGVEHDSNKVSRYIDGWNLSDTKLKLRQVPQEDCKGRPAGSHVQYRLKPAKENEPQEPCSSESYSSYPSYQPLFTKDVLITLQKIKHKMGANPEADMGCHFGSAIVRVPREEKVEERQWSIDEATVKFQSSTGEHFWKLRFKEGVDLNKRIFRGHYKEKTPEDVPYVARHDLTFITPCMHQIRCKVWVANKNFKGTFDDIPSDIKNLLGEIHFKDETTRILCRGWLVLKFIKYLQADILFPGCEFDCIFTVRGRAESALATDAAPEEKVRNALLTYLSGLTLTEEDAFGLRFPEQDIPEGFHLIHKRLSKRTEYTTDEGFVIIISEERTWNLGIEETIESTDVHLHCEEWDTLLSSGVWEPEDIVRKLPEFFEFVKEVQGTVFHEMERAVLTETIPPEILARGPFALEAYKKAISYGKTYVKRFPLMLIGQDRAGKTSLKKSLKGICFNPDEDSTVGIDVDPSHFKVSTETWRTGTINQGKDCNADISCDYHTGLIMGKQIVDSVKEKRKSRKMETDTDENQYSFDSEANDVPGEPRPTESSKDAEHFQTSRDPEPIFSRHEPHVSADQTEGSQEVLISTTNAPEEVAAVAESLLRGDLEDSREDIFSTVWDFAGQSVYYETHPLFLTAKAIYCLVYDLSLNPHDMAKPLVKQGVYKEKQESFNLKTNLDYLDFWMRSVASVDNCLEKNSDASPKSEVLPEKLPPVFLVCTHADTPYGHRNPRKLSREIFGFLKSKPYGVHLFDVFCVDNTSLKVNNTDCPEVVRLRQQILAVAKALPHINDAIPIKWLKFEKMLQAVKKGYKCISLETAGDIASQFWNIDKDKEFTTLMNYLHDLRCLIHFDDTAELKNLIVLNPQWLVDVFKKVITIKPYNEGEKQFIDLWCKLEREGILDEKLLAHVWGSLFSEKETSEILIEIMKKFSLLCPWPSDSSSDKSYLVPSMLKSHPPKKILQLTASAKFPTLYIKFANGQVPPAFFPRLVQQFFEWSNEKLWRAGKPQLFHNFARFFTTKDDYSVILICHSSTVEVVVHGGNRSLELPDELSSRTMLSTDLHYDAVVGFICSRVVSKLGLMLECMRNEFCWLRNMKYEMSVICPVCCQGKAVDYCQTHQVEECKEDQCLHFLTVSELYRSKEDIFCTRSASAQNTRVQVMQFAPWFPTQGQQLAVGERDGGLFSLDEENVEKTIALPDGVLESLLDESCDSKRVICRLKESLQLDQASLEQPDPGSKQLIRCLARKAKCSNRLDVVKHLREITPAGTTGPLLSENLDVRSIPISQGRKLTIALSGGEQWMLIAEKLGLSPEEIRYLDKRTLNPVDALLGYVSNKRYLTVGELYDVLCDCGVPVMADEL